MSQVDPERKKEYEMFEKLIKFFSKKQLKLKNAVFQERRVRFEYFRYDQFKEIVAENKFEIPKLLPSINFDQPLDTDEGLKNLLAILMEKKVILKWERVPEDKPYKWPKNLTISKDQANPSDKAFYAWTIQPKQSKWLGIGIIAGIASICLFQIWPLMLKLAVFYIALILLYVMLGVIAIRLVVYMVFRVFGVEIWILPNLFADAGFLDSFKPFLDVQKCKDGMLLYLVRFIMLVAIAYGLFRVSTDPTILSEYSDMGKQSFDDIAQWGRLRLEGKVDEEITSTGYKRPGDDLRKHFSDLLKDDLENEKKAKEKRETFNDPDQQNADDLIGNTEEQEIREEKDL